MKTLTLSTRPLRLDWYWIAFGVILLVAFVFNRLGDPLIVTSVLVALALIPLTIGNRKLLIFLTCFSFYLAQSSVLIVYQIFYYARWVLLLTCIIVAIIQPIVSKKRIPKTWKENKALWLFSAAAYFSLTYSVSPLLTIVRASTITALFFVVSQLITPFIATYGPEVVLELFLYAVFPLYFVSFVTIGQDFAYFANPDYTYAELETNKIFTRAFKISPTTGFARFHGIFLNPNTIGILTALLFPFVLLKLSQEKGNRFYVFLLIMMTVVLLLSGSREGIGGCIISTCYFYLRSYGIKRFAKKLGVIFLPIAVLFFFVSGAWLSLYLRLGNYNFLLGGGRVEAWAAAVQIFLMKPLLGHGFGTEEILFRRMGYVFLFHEGTYAHNSYLGLLLQVGIVGTLILFLPLFWLCISEFFVSNPSPIRIALHAMVISGLIACMTESWIYAVGNSQTLVFWSGIAILNYLRDTSKSTLVHVA